MATRRKANARARLDAIFARDPDAWAKYRLTDLAARIGVSKQRVAQLLPHYSAGRLERVVERKLARFIEEHPAALRRRVDGGMTINTIARALEISPEKLLEARRKLQLPERKGTPLTPAERSRRYYERNRERRLAASREWCRRHPERTREIRRAADRRYNAKVLRQEQCISCQRRFPWTQAREDRRRYRGARMVCSVQCGRAAWRRELADERRPHTARGASQRRRPAPLRRPPQKDRPRPA